jgi:8-oxo-dGTP pyrophosphatase MutT (NUDIX family)
VSETLVARLRALPPGDGRAWQGRPAAVLLAFSPAGPYRGGAAATDGTGVDPRADLALVLVRRPDSMRHHAGQVSLPGGAVEDGDADGIAAALREAREEVGLDTRRVEVLGTAGRVPVVVSGFDVELVVGLWDGRGPLVPNPGEVDGILRPTLLQLADPANHGTLPLADLVTAERARSRRLPPDAFSPVFHVDGHVVWGFTAGVLAELLAALGLPGPPLPPTWPLARAPRPPDPTAATRPRR